MDQDLPPGHDEGELLLAGDTGSATAQRVALQREKEELRRERDHLMLDLARDLGPAGVAERFGVSSAAMARLLQGARERLGGIQAGRDARGSEIGARRLRTGESRWAIADAHYEALGRRSS